MPKIISINQLVVGKKYPYDDVYACADSMEIANLWSDDSREIIIRGQDRLLFAHQKSKSRNIQITQAWVKE